MPNTTTQRLVRRDIILLKLTQRMHTLWQANCQLVRLPNKGFAAMELYACRSPVTKPSSHDTGVLVSRGRELPQRLARRFA